MKKEILSIFFAIFISVNLINAQEGNRHTLVPLEAERVFEEGNQKFSYEVKDDIFVSLAFNSFMNGEYVFDMTVDNQSEDTLEFDPAEIHLFRYTQDTLAEKKIYYSQDPRQVLDSIDITIDAKKDGIKRNTFVSIFLGAAYITTEILGVNGGLDYGAIQAIRFSHDVTQMGLGVAREEKTEKLYDLEYAGDYWLHGAMQHRYVFPHSYESGKIHFQIPQSEVVKIYVPIDSRIYSYTFHDVACK